MDACYSGPEETELLSRAQRRVLWIVLAINAGMFALEIVAGVLARSTALLADSLDMLGDAIGYGLSLYAIGRGRTWAARAATVKGCLMALLGLGVLAEAVRRLLLGESPVVGVMLPVATLALAANLICMRLLHPHRADDLNLRSSWVFSRVDVLANLGTLVAAIAVMLLKSGWPDFVVGVLVAIVVLRDAILVLREALGVPREGANVGGPRVPRTP
jgi:cation diffusion facilitator family transporter